MDFVVLIWLLIALPVVEGAGSWRGQDALRKFVLEKPVPIEFKHDDVTAFLRRLSDQLSSMPTPDNSSFTLVHDENSRAFACRIPEDDSDSYDASGSPDAIMKTVMRSFADGNCARRTFGKWYYRVCGNLEVLRSPFTLGKLTRTGKKQVIPFKAFESLGVFGRDRNVSNHFPSIFETRYVSQTFYDGSKCTVEGDERRIKSTVYFKCSDRFVSGYVHIHNVIEDNPCEYRLILHSSDFCDSDWLAGKMEDEKNTIPCRIYFHPERIEKLLKFIDKYMMEQKERSIRYEWWNDEGYGNYYEPYSDRSYEEFDERDSHFDVIGEKERKERIADYVMNELVWASLNPDAPYTEKERRLREEEEKEGKEIDLEILAKLKEVLEETRLRLKIQRYERDREEEQEEREERGEDPIVYDKPAYDPNDLENDDHYWEFSGMSYTELYQKTFDKYLEWFDLDAPLNFYAGWLDYIKGKNLRETKLVHSVVISPNRKLPIQAFMALDGLVTSVYWELMGDFLKAAIDEQKKNKEEPPPEYNEDELDEEDIIMIRARFLEVYKAMKEGGDDVLFDLLDDDEY